MFFEKFSINKKLNAFTMAELMIVLGLIGVVAALTMPQLYKGLPRQESEMERKITYTMEQTVANMFEDETMYPKTSNDLAEGFQNTGNVYVNGVTYGGNTKFCELFASKFNRVNRKDFFAAEANTSAAQCTAAHSTPTDAAVTSPTFISNDGAYWYLPVTNFPNGYAKVTVDVNGAKGPNCSANSAGAACADAKAKAAAEPDRHALDRYEYFVKHNGTVTLNGPTSASAAARKFDIQVNVKTKSASNADVTASTGGRVSITDCGTSGASCGAKTYGTYNGNTIKFEELQRGHIYLLESYPAPESSTEKNYTTTWANNKKNVLIGNQDVTTSLTFREIPKSNVTLSISGCPYSSPTSCGTTKFYKNCKYKHVTAGAGTFKYDSTHDLYVYAGINDPGADYEYICDTATISGTLSGNVYTWSNLRSGNYKIEVKPSNTTSGGYTIPNIRNNTYIQSIRLGSENAEFYVKYVPVE